MVIADNQLKLADINSLIKQVPRYPITVKRLVELARARRFDNTIISFYKAFPPYAVFADQDDMEARSVAVEMMEREDQPPEDEVRGAED